MRTPKSGAADRESPRWFPYYAGFSPGFARDAILEVAPQATDCVVDPWNGSGTTTRVAATIRRPAVGIDANPALVLAARGSLLSDSLSRSLESLAADIWEHASAQPEGPEEEPLEQWFRPATARHLRALERAILHVLVGPPHDPPDLLAVLDDVTPLAAFYYTALFRLVRSFVDPHFIGTNPTWVKTPDPKDRLYVRPSAIRKAWISCAAIQQSMILESHASTEAGFEVTSLLGDSRSLPFADGTFDGAVTSPPYLTRIDYVQATLPELAVVGLSPGEIRHLRAAMIGTPTIEAAVEQALGAPVRKLLERVKAHPSQASSTYYLKWLSQYFVGMALSIRELRRVIRLGGRALLVVQDSYYKEIHVDTAALLVSLAEEAGWGLLARLDFPAPANMASMNPRARAYRNRFRATESVLILA